MAQLLRGDLAPRILHRPPGPRAGRLARQLSRHEAPGINTVGLDGSAFLWEEARGANVLDVDGNRYLDFTAGFGVANVGHRHPHVVAAVRHQAGRLMHGLADVHSHPLRARLAQKLTRRVPIQDAQVYFAVSGSDAVEVALKTAVLATGRGGILAFEPAYHGLTLGALQVTSRTAFRHPFAAHFHTGVHRLPFGCPANDIDRLLRREADIGCVIFEPVVGREGVFRPPSGWIADLVRICRRRNVLVIADEIFTGFGRTGLWFALDGAGAEADLICCGKALGGGMPIAAVVGRRRLLSAWRQPGEALHTGTFVAHPLSCAAALAVLDVLARERLPQRAAALGGRVAERLGDWAGRFAAVAAIRGCGLLWAVELRDAEIGKRVGRRLLDLGLLALVGGPGGRVLQLVPPLVITDEQLALALGLLESALNGA